MILYDLQTPRLTVAQPFFGIASEVYGRRGLGDFHPVGLHGHLDRVNQRPWIFYDLLVVIIQSHNIILLLFSATNHHPQ
jgi:hypothetical protein